MYKNACSKSCYLNVAKLIKQSVLIFWWTLWLLLEQNVFKNVHSCYKFHNRSKSYELKQAKGLFTCVKCKLSDNTKF